MKNWSKKDQELFDKWMPVLLAQMVLEKECGVKTHIRRYKTGKIILAKNRKQ